MGGMGARKNYLTELGCVKSKWSAASENGVWYRDFPAPVARATCCGWAPSPSEPRSGSAFFPLSRGAGLSDDCGMGSYSRRASNQRGRFRTSVSILALMTGTMGVARVGAAQSVSATNNVATSTPPAATNPAVTPPPPPPRPGAAAISSFLIKPGFRIELVAGESLVNAPVAMAFDENGRLFVAELPGFSGTSGARTGRIRVLEDTDGDGVFDTGTIYADNLPWPSAIACYGGGVFVAAATDVIYLKDNRGDGIADSRKVVFSGFGGGTKVVSPELQISSLTWGPDNRFHAVSGGLGGPLPATGSAEEIASGDSDFSFDPRTAKLFADAGSAQTGVTFDNRGRRYVGDFSRPLRLAMYELPYFTRSAFVPRPQPLFNSANPATPVYRWTGLPPAAVTNAAVIHAQTRPAPGLTNLLSPSWLTNGHSATTARADSSG